MLLIRLLFSRNEVGMERKVGSVVLSANARIAGAVMLKMVAKRMMLTRSSGDRNTFQTSAKLVLNSGMVTRNYNNSVYLRVKIWLRVGLSKRR